MAPNKGKEKADEEVEEVNTGILDDIPAPITTFDLSDHSKFAETYEKCIKDIRKEMDDQTDVKFTFVIMAEGKEKEIVVPVTPAEDVTDKGIYVIRLKYGEKSIDLVTERYQTWFRGIVTNSGHRFEIDKLPKIMKNSRPLHTTGIYPKLLIKCDLAELIVGYQQFLSAFETVAGFEGSPKDLNKVREAIAILLVMFFEGPRLLPVQELVQNALSQFSFAEVGATMAAFRWGWKKISTPFDQ